MDLKKIGVIMNILFTSAKISSLKIDNRFVRSATYDGGADKGGFVSDWQIDLYSALAKGQVGLIVIGVVNVNSAGKISPTQNALSDDKFIPGLQRLADTVHAKNSKLAVQLFHAGREAFRRMELLGMRAIAPSEIKSGEDPYFEGNCREMKEEEIWATVEAFGQAARRAKEAGCDAVQIHGAHAYLLSQFLSPQSNKRKDNWGGSLENRLRLHGEIYRTVRAEVGPDYPVMIKLGVEDGFPGGLKFQEGLEAAVQLAEIGYDCLEVSQGLRGRDYGQTEVRDKIVKKEREAYFREWTREVKKRVRVPVMMVGGLRSLDLMEEIVAGDEADFISLSRPLIREPDLVASWQADQSHRSTCISCNKCWEHILTGARLQCMAQRKGKDS